MTNAKAAIASFLLVLLGAGCGPAGEAIPAAQADAGSAYTSPYSKMHADIPADAGDGQVYEFD